MANEEDLKLCIGEINSDDWIELIVRYEDDIEPVLKKYNTECYQIIDDEYIILYIKITDFLICQFLFGTYSQREVPLPLGPYGKIGLEESGIKYFHSQPFIPLKGKGVIIGIIDSGIDYAHPVFRYKDGTSKILNIWDQTALGDTPEGFIFGAEYTNDQINEALNSNNPYEIVPEQDETGHGTFLAGIAAGVEDKDNDFVGAAPEAELVVVKLKKMGRCLAIADGLEGKLAYQDIDVVLGIKYIEQKARKLNRPLVIIIGLGSNIGFHDGTLLLELYIDKQSELQGTVFVVASGNEANLGHHFRGQYLPEEDYQDIEFNVAKGEEFLWFTINAVLSDIYSIGLISPTGEFISRIPARVDKIEKLQLILDLTEIAISYRVYEGQRFITSEMANPTEGIWVIRLFGDLVLNGRYDIYLPREGWVKEETRFIQPNPYTTITYPSSSKQAITVGAYDHERGSLYPASGRGLTSDDKMKPDLVAPGVNIFGPLPGNQYGTMTGTSVAAAITAGSCALLLEWADVLGNLPRISPQLTKIWLIRGANRKDYLEYPNPLWGFGQLDLRNSFDIIKDIYFD